MIEYTVTYCKRTLQKTHKRSIMYKFISLKHLSFQILENRFLIFTGNWGNPIISIIWQKNFMLKTISFKQLNLCIFHDFWNTKTWSKFQKGFFCCFGIIFLRLLGTFLAKTGSPKSATRAPGSWEYSNFLLNSIRFANSLFLFLKPKICRYTFSLCWAYFKAFNERNIKWKFARNNTSRFELFTDIRVYFWVYQLRTQFKKKSSSNRKMKFQKI